MKHATPRRSMRVQYLVLTLLLSVGLCLLSGTLMAQQANVTPLMSEVLTDISGKEGLMLTVEYPPAGRTLSIVTMHMHFSTCWRAPS